jgi:hypothetical protein
MWQSPYNNHVDQVVLARIETLARWSLIEHDKESAKGSLTIPLTQSISLKT